MDKNRIEEIRKIIENEDTGDYACDVFCEELLSAVDELQTELDEERKMGIRLINRIDDIGDELYDVSQAFEVVEGLYEVQATRISKLEVENKRFSDILYKWFGMNYKDGKEAFDAMIAKTEKVLKKWEDTE